MNKLKVLLLAPTYIDEPNTMYFPIGMAYLASYIASKGFEVDGFNMNNTGYGSNGLQELKEKIEQERFDVIGIGGLTVAFEQIEKLVKFIRTVTDAKIVLGGGITSCESEIVIKELKPDFMAIGEAELIFEEILLHIVDAKKYPLPKGSWSYENGVVVSANSEDYAIKDLDSLPFPDYKIMGIEGFLDLQEEKNWSHHKTELDIGKAIPISASRSCPFKCTFCHHAGMGKYRKHSIKYAVDFIKRMKQEFPFVNHFAIYDELFSASKQRVMEFCKEVKPLEITFFCQLRVDQLDEEMLMTMKDAGCSLISYGIESGSQKVIDSMQKKITVEQIENAMKLTKKAKIAIQGNFLFGDSEETEDTVKESIRFQEKNKLYFNDWSMVIPYPGTVLHSRALQKNMIKDRLQFIKNVSNTSKYLWNTPINLTEFSDDEYIKIYTYLRELNDINHRKVLSKIIDAKVLDDFHSYIEIECPTCLSKTVYDKVPFPLNESITAQKDRASFFGFLGVNLVCPQCRQEHHLLPKRIPHLKSLFDSFVEKLDFFKKTGDIVVMPAVDRYFNAIFEDLNLFDLSPFAVLDSRSYRLGNDFLGKKVENLDDNSVQKYLNKKFLILPWVEYEDAYKLLLDNGIEEKNILSWNMQEG